MIDVRKLKPSKKLKSNKNNALNVNHKLKISACYIVKNEEKNLKLSLDSLKSQVDEIVIVDTGSTDNTIEIAKSYGAKVIETEWQDDFSTPRNIAIDNASGDWIVFIDADEYFSNDTIKNIRSVIEQAEKNHKWGLIINRINIDIDNNNQVQDNTYILRIFKNMPGFYYVGKIHEEWQTPEKTPVPNLIFVPENILLLYHTGYSKTVNLDKARRNLKLLLNELEDTKHPDRIYGYIAQCYNGLHDIANAEKFALLDINCGRRDVTYASSSYRILLNILARDANRSEDRFNYVSRAVKDFPEIPEFHAEYAECLALKKDFPTAISEMETAIKSYSSYKAIEPTMFTPQMAEFAKKRLNLWRSYINEKN